MQEEGATTFEAMEQAGHTRSTMTGDGFLGIVRDFAG